MSQSSQHCRTMEDVAHYIEGMRFRKKLVGGVDEADVWKQIEELHREYEAVFLAQEVAHQAELDQARRAQSRQASEDFHVGQESEDQGE